MQNTKYVGVSQHRPMLKFMTDTHSDTQCNRKCTTRCL